MSAQQVLDNLSDAARLLSQGHALNFKGDKEGFSKIIEDLVERARLDPQADMICSMLYAARESVEMKGDF